MARDYKNSGSRGGKKKQAAKRQGLPGIVWLVSGLLIGLFVALLVHLYHLQQGNRLVIDGPERVIQPEQRTGAREEPPAQEQRPRFEFYKLLPEQEVVVPPPEREAKPAAKPRPRRTPEPGARYLLQAGSFQQFGDADRLKAQLALLGVEAHIQKVELTGGETWHRVRVGPIADQDELNRIRQQLAANGVETILLKAGG